MHEARRVRAGRAPGALSCVGRTYAQPGLTRGARFRRHMARFSPMPRAISAPEGGAGENRREEKKCEPAWGVKYELFRPRHSDTKFIYARPSVV